MRSTWALLLRNTNFAVPSFEAFAHNLTHDDAVKLESEIRQQRVEGERVTLVYIVDGLEPHQDCEPKDCDGCSELTVAAHKQELGELEKAMAKRGGKILRDNQVE
jgi:hypothetical protein